jgi:polyisoprenoid-binding protein YceI
MPKPGFFRRKSTYLIGVPVIVILAVVVAPFVYIHFIEGPAPKKFALTKPTAGASTGSTAASGRATVSVDGAWKITAGSQAGYRVKETLFGQSNTAAGRTTSVKGTLTINATTVPAADFTVDLTTVKSDQARRDAQFQGRIMDTATFPTATFKLTKPIALTNVPPNLTPVKATATGDLTLHGKTKSVTFELQAQRNGDKIEVSGSIPVTFTDYGIDNPSGGPATTEDHGELEFHLFFTRA